jgi:Tfp pilus assembly protein PilV
MKLFSQKLKGFTVLETLFAIVIFSLALVSLLAVSGQGVIAVSSAKEEMIASYLNQEAIEAIRWYRDNKKISTTPAPTFPATYIPDLLQCLTSTASGGVVSYCNVNVPTSGGTPSFSKCGTSGAYVNCNNMYENNGVYTSGASSGATATVFRRGTTIYLDLINSTARVMSRVTWTSKGVDRSHDVQVTLKDW